MVFTWAIQALSTPTAKRNVVVKSNHCWSEYTDK